MSFIQIILKKLFQETFPEYYNVNSKKETHIYLSTALEEIKETIARIEEHRIENITQGNLDIAEGLEKLTERVDGMMNNRVNIERLQMDVERLRIDTEKLKDSVRANIGKLNGNH